MSCHERGRVVRKIAVSAEWCDRTIHKAAELKMVIIETEQVMGRERKREGKNLQQGEGKFIHAA